MTTKKDIVEAIHEELDSRFNDDIGTTAVINFITTALGNFFTTDQLEEFYEFLENE